MHLLIGGTGRTGTLVARALLAAGERVRIFGRDASRARELTAAGAEFAQGDLARSDDLRVALRGVHAVFFPSVLDAPALRFVVNVVTLAREAGVTRLVNLSALGASPASDAGGFRWHAVADEIVAQSGLPFTHLLPCFYLQNLLGTFRRRGDGGLSFLNPVGSAAMAMIDIRDVAEVGAHLVRHGGFEGEALQLTGPEPLRYEEIVARASALDANRKWSAEDCTWEAFECALNVIGEVPANVRAEVARLYDFLRAGIYAHPTDDVRRVLGRPARKLEEFLGEVFLPAANDSVHS